MRIGTFFDETNMLNYLDTISEMKNLIILICAKDTIGFNVGKAAYEKLSNLGLKELGDGSDIRRNHWRGFIAVIVDKQVIFENLSDVGSNVSFSSRIDDINLNLYSSPFNNDNLASIKLDGEEYCVNNRGLNFVIIERINGVVIDSVCFDTHSKNVTCSRRKNVLTNNVLYSEIEKIGRKIDEKEISIKTQVLKNQLLLWQCYKKDDESVIEAEKRFFFEMPQASGDIRMMQLAILLQLLYVDIICKKNDIEYWLSFGGLLGAVRNKRCIPWDDDIDICMMRDSLEKFRKAIEIEELPIYLKETIAVDANNINYIYKIFFKKYTITCSLDIFVYDFAVGLIEDNRIAHIRLNREIAEEGWKLHCAINNSKMPMESSVKKCNDQYLKLFEKYQCRAVEEIGITDRQKGENIIWGLDNFRYEPAVKGSVPIDEIFPLNECKLEGFIFPSPKNPEEYCKKMYGNIYSMPDDMLIHRHRYLNREDRDTIIKILMRYLPEFGMDSELEKI